MSLFVQKPELPELIPLHRLPDLIPSPRRGKKLALATIYRWSQRGRIPTVKIGGSRYVSSATLSQLCKTITQPASSAPKSDDVDAKRASAALDALLTKRRP